MGATTTDEAIFALGEDLHQRMKGETPGIFNKDYWQGRLLEWAMKDASFKVDLFRFVDVLPTLHTKDQVAGHVREYLLRDGRVLPSVIRAALTTAASTLGAGLGQKAIRHQVGEMAARFIAGENADEAVKTLKRLHDDGIAFTVDLLGEATVSEAECDAYAQRYLELIDRLADETRTWAADDTIDWDHRGRLPRANVSIKVSAMYSQIDAADARGSVERLSRRLLPLFLRAKERGVFLNLDLEQWALHGVTYDVFENVLSAPELRGHPHVGIVVQAYLKSAASDIERLSAFAKRRGAPVTVRLVKGAYWDHETVIARQRGWSSPVFESKAQTDANFERLTARLLDDTERLWPAIASHNLRSLTNAIVLAKARGLPERAYELQMLFGMAEPERKVLRGLGHRVRVYAPVGDMLPGMAYLVRRLLENTSNSGFLRLSHVEKVELKALLAPPAPSPESESRTRGAHVFENEPLLDFTQEANVVRFARAVGEVRASLPRKVPVVIDGDARDRETFIRRAPSESRLVVSRVSAGTRADVDQALDIAARAFPAWRDTSIAARAQVLERLGALLQRDRFELAALQTFEVGKLWRDADADVAEAIDFCRFYAQRAPAELGERIQASVTGEDNRIRYEGRGVCVVIAPWNFPAAILTGMTTAALVAGNTVVMKPAEQSSAVAYEVFRKLIEAGAPPGVVQFLPGVGETLGPSLVSDVRVAQVAFTGSKPVGLGIIEAAARTLAGQREVRRVVCEMGGKNAVIVDEDADLDEAVLGVVQGAFGFAGQKCSATSRVLVLERVAEAFTNRLVEATRSLVIGKAHEPGVGLGPVVDEESQRRLLSIIDQPGSGVEVVFRGDAPIDGSFVPPTILRTKDANARVMQEELFGPVLTLCVVSSFDSALDVALQTEFALTGAVYSRTPSHLEQARRKFRVGNLYLNRGSTGALVHRQPFGGSKMSGTGTKAGGEGYLLHFADPYVVTENTMRRGFTPEMQS